jgi:branched-chain amino acid transport system permease protein
MAGAFTVILLGLNILIGYSGQASLGHAAFVLIGAYVTILFQNGEHGFNWPLYLTIPLGGIVAGILGIFLGLPAVRVKGPYLGIITLGFSSVVPLVLKSRYLVDITGGQLGTSLSPVAVPEFLAPLTDTQWQYFIILLPAMGLLLFANFLMKRHRIGRGLALIRQSEELARSVGVNVFKYKLIAFALSAFYAGIGGGLICILIGTVNANSFTLNDSIGYLTAIAVGGLGSIFGSVVGAIFLGYQNELSQWLATAITDGEALQWGLFGVVLIFVMILAPRGLAGELREWVQATFVQKTSRY